MDAQRWEQIQSIFTAAADLPNEQKRRAVEELCGSDHTLAGTVLELLDEDSGRHLLLDGGLVAVADVALESDHVRSLIERQIGPYRLLRTLGEGGMGVVFLAERNDIGGLVAIKLLRDAWLSPARRERFVLEQQTLVKLNHPAIVRIYDASTMDDGTPWFVMEYADGRALTEYLRSRAAGLRADLLLFRQVCEAVQYAHSHAIIHRDLKPSNILVTSAGEVKLLDFGIAKQLDLAARNSRRTTAGLRLMTPAYAAPEQKAGADVGVFTDVYSLGVILYEILTGELPSAVDAREDQLPEKPSVPARRNGQSQLSKQQWADLDVLCLTALQPEPERRYRSVDALIRDVSAFLEGRVLEARPSSLAYVAGKFIRRNRLPLASVAASLVLLAGAAIFFTLRLAHARDAAVAEAARTARIQRFMLNMIGDGDQEAGPANDLKVVTLLDREAQQAGSLSADKQTQVELYETLGSMYDRLGKFDKSEQLLSLALTNAKQVLGVNSPKTADILVQLGVMRGDRGDVKQAKQDIQQVLDMAAARHLAASDPTVIHAQIAMGRIAIQSSDLHNAIAVLTPIAQTDPGRSGVSENDVRDSLSALATAELYRQLLGEAHPQTGVDLVNLASIKATQGDFAQAEPLYREGIAIMKGWYGADHPDVATALSILARILDAEKKDDEAEPILRDALRIQEKVYGPVEERVSFTLSALGEIAIRRKELQSAEADFSRALAIDRSIFGAENYKSAGVESSLGLAYLEESRNVLAEAALRHAVSVLAPLPAGNNMIATTRERWGRALLALKRYDEAEVQLTSAAELIKAQRNAPVAEVDRIDNELIALYLATHRPEQARSYQTVLSSKPHLAGR
jgi:serine/threonine-protein kinase